MTEDPKKTAKIAVIGAGWWSQGWHLPALHRNERADVVAIVDTSPHPQSVLNPDLRPLIALGETYGARTYSSATALLEAEGPSLDGVLVATPHATHHTVYMEIVREIDRRNGEEGATVRPLHVLMEKPMSTDVRHAVELFTMAKAPRPCGSRFWINHSANWRVQTRLLREAVASGTIGRVRHVSASFASPLRWIFDDPACTGWNAPTGNMIRNGFAWGQASHLLAFLYHVCGDLEPAEVSCTMNFSATTGADVSHAATVRCSDGEGDDVVVSISGTALLPGNAHSDPPVPKRVRLETFGERGSLHYGGDDRDPASGRLEARYEDGSVEVLHKEFRFENLDNEDCGPESLQEFVRLCCGECDVYEGADASDGLRSIQTIDAMYRSHASKKTEQVYS